jgi:carbon monoxide dehydrogenase subunit G
MNVNGEYRIPAPRERIWEALRDPETLRACIPGCEAVRKISDMEFEVQLTAQVGAVTTVFTGHLTSSEEDQPRCWTVNAQVQSRNAGFADGHGQVTLSAEADGTVIGYRGRLEPGGRLAAVGQRLLHGVAIRMANEFFARLIDRLRPRPPGAAPLDMAEPMPVAPPARALNPIAPGAEPAAAPVPEPAPPPVESYTARGQRKVLIIGVLLYLAIIALIFWPRA